MMNRIEQNMDFLPDSSSISRACYNSFLLDLKIPPNDGGGGHRRWAAAGAGGTMLTKKNREWVPNFLVFYFILLIF